MFRQRISEIAQNRCSPPEQYLLLSRKVRDRNLCTSQTRLCRRPKYVCLLSERLQHSFRTLPENVGSVSKGSGRFQKSLYESVSDNLSLFFIVRNASLWMYETRAVCCAEHQFLVSKTFIIRNDCPGVFLERSGILRHLSTA